MAWAKWLITDSDSKSIRIRGEDVKGFPFWDIYPSIPENKRSAGRFSLIARRFIEETTITFI
jgi:hypothetical protein